MNDEGYRKENVITDLQLLARRLNAEEPSGEVILDTDGENKRSSRGST